MCLQGRVPSVASVLLDVTSILALSFVSSVIFWLVGEFRLRRYDEDQKASVERRFILELEFGFNTTIHSMLGLSHWDSNASGIYVSMSSNDWEATLTRLREKCPTRDRQEKYVHRMVDNFEFTVSVDSHHFQHFNRLVVRRVLEARNALNSWFPEELDVPLRRLTSYRWVLQNMPKP